MDRAVAEEVRVFPDLEGISHGAAEVIAAAAERAVAARGRFVMALSGGNTPRRLYQTLAGPFRSSLPWDRTHLFWGDERYLPHSDPRSNYAMAREALLDLIGLPPSQVHPIPTDLPEPEQAAGAYEEHLRSFFGGAEPQFDVILLGMGADGHTASLFPETPAPLERERWVVAVKASVEPPIRISLTMPVLTQGAAVLFLVTGADKRDVWRLMEQDPAEAFRRYPAMQVAAGSRHVIWFVDEHLVRP